MKLQAEKHEGLSISGHGPGWIAVNGERKSSSILLSSRGLFLEWSCQRFEDLNESHFDQIAQLDAELVLFGSGTRLRFAPASWLQALMARGIGMETMDTGAACRTYNILASEGRHVLAALLVEQV